MTIKNGELFMDASKLLNASRIISQQMIVPPETVKVLKNIGAEVGSVTLVSDMITLLYFFPSVRTALEEFSSTIQSEATSDMADLWWILMYVFVPCHCLAEVTSHYGFKSLLAKDAVDTTEYDILNYYEAAAQFYVDQNKSSNNRNRPTRRKYYNIAFARFVEHYLRFLASYNKSKETNTHTRLPLIGSAVRQYMATSASAKKKDHKSQRTPRKSKKARGK
jgi:hypothetical protein